MIRCYLGLGSNLRSPQRQLRNALPKLAKLPKTYLARHSSLYTSYPLGGRGQPKYCNMVVAIDTALPAKQLLIYCQTIEKQQHRLRKKHWGARTLDIDILLYGQQTIHDAILTVPHPEMIKRDFVLIPLLEIAPDACMPCGIALTNYLKQCELLLLYHS